MYVMFERMHHKKSIEKLAYARLLDGVGDHLGDVAAQQHEFGVDIETVLSERHEHLAVEAGGVADLVEILGF